MNKMNTAQTRRYIFQRNVNGEFVDCQKFSTIADLVRYANNYQGYDLNYNSVRYHLRRCPKFEFDRKNGIWNARLVVSELIN